MKRFKMVLLVLVGLLYWQESFALFSAPTAPSPGSNSTDVPCSPKLSYAAKYNLDHWIFEVSKDSNFNTLVSRVKEKYFYTYATALEHNTKYYWRGRYYDNNDSSHWGPVASFTTSSHTIIHSPKDSTSVWGLMYMSVYRSNHSHYEFLLDTTDQFNSPLNRRMMEHDSNFNNFWIEIPYDSLYFGATYYFKVRSFDGSDTSGWSNTHRVFSTMSYTNFVFHSREVSSVEIGWSVRQGMTKYEVQLDVDTNFNTSKLVEIDHIPTTNRLWVHELDFDSKYYWRVRAINAVDTFIWSDYSSVTTEGVGYPTLGYYANSELQFFQDEATHGIQLQLDTSPTFNTPYLLDSLVLRDTSQTKAYWVRIPTENLYYGKTYYARIRAFHSKDSSSWKSRSRTISLFGQLRYPYTSSIIEPGDSVVFDNSIKHGNYFRIQIDSTPTYNSPALLDTVYTTTQPSSAWFKPPLEYSTTYYWRIQVAHKKDTSVWSDINYPRIFHTVSHPNLTYPSNLAKLYTLISPGLRWDAIKYADYEILLDTSEDFNSSILLRDTITDFNGEYQVNHLLFNAQYYWKVRFIKDDIASVWSPLRSFFTATQVRNLDPEQNDSNVYPSFLDWSSITGTTGCIVKLDTQHSMATAQIDTIILDNPFFYSLYDAGIELNFEQPYFYQVSLFHSTDTLHSDVIRFITRSRQAPKLTSPANESSDLSLSSTLRWNLYSNAKGYLVEISENPDMSDSSAKYVVSGSYKPSLGFNKTYYWRVRAMFNSTTPISDYSVTWKFSTIESLPLAQLLSPLNKAENVNTDEKLKWKSVVGATGYTIEISLDSNFLGKFTRSSTSNQLSFNFAKNKTYYWRVKYKKDGANSPWSEAWSFTTKSGTNAVDPAHIYGIEVYPVPVIDRLHIDCSGTEFRPLNLRDIYGKIVYVNTNKAKAGVQSIDCSALSRGTYILTLSDGTSITSMRIVLQ